MMKPTSTPMRSRYNIEALERGLDILALFTSDTPSLSLTQIVEILNINKSTAYRVLSTLEGLNYLERDPITRLYRPGLKVLQLGFTAISNLDVREVAHPFLVKLSQDLGETVSLAVLDGVYTVYVDRVRNQAIVGVVLGVGSRLPAHCSSLGKVLLSDLPTDELERRLAQAELTSFAPNTISSQQDLISELSKVREQGYAIGDEELAVGLRAAAAPIRDINHRIVAAINATGATINISYERLNNEIIPALIETAHQISITLGYTPN